METNGVSEQQPQVESEAVSNLPEMVSDPISPRETRVTSQMGNGECSCGGMAGDPAGAGMVELAYVYAIGRIEARFPNLSVEKEFAQAVGRESTEGQTDRQAIYSVLSKRKYKLEAEAEERREWGPLTNGYLARQMCWVFTIEGLDTYLLKPTCPADLEFLVEAIRPAPSPMDVDVVIGKRGAIAPPNMCNGLMVPIVFFDQIYSFDIDTLIEAIPCPESIEEGRFRSAANELFMRIMQMADNAGATDEHRALNYLAVRYHAIYAQAVDEFGRSSALTGVEVRPSRLSGTRKVVDVIFAYSNRQTDVTEKYFVRVDVSEEWPFLVSKLSPYYNR